MSSSIGSVAKVVVDFFLSQFSPSSAARCDRRGLISDSFKSKNF